MTDTYGEHKVLPFKGALGDVPGHAINVLNYEGEPVTRVCIKQWDEDAKMMVERVINMADWTTYTHRKWPACGEVVAVLTERGRRISATTMHVTHYGETDRAKAPTLARAPFAIHALRGGTRLASIAGVSDWAFSDRRPEDAELILDPWKRDNEAFAASMAAKQASAPVAA